MVDFRNVQGIRPHQHGARRIPEAPTAFRKDQDDPTQHGERHV